MSYLVPDAPLPPVCQCGHREDIHANLTAERARWPRRCQAPVWCACAEYRAAEDQEG